MRRATITSAVLFLALPLVLTGRPVTLVAAAPPQIAAGVFANWGDGETWSRYLDLSDETDIGLGLQPTGRGGTMLISFSARWHSRIVSGQPQAIYVQVAAPALINPNTVRLPNLVFNVDAKTDRAVQMDFSSRLAVDRPGPIAPGAEVVTSGIAKIDLAELARLGRATIITATILSVDVEFSAKQRQALKTYAQKVASQR